MSSLGGSRGQGARGERDGRPAVPLNGAVECAGRCHGGRSTRAEAAFWHEWGGRKGSTATKGTGCVRLSTASLVSVTSDAVCL